MLRHIDIPPVWTLGLAAVQAALHFWLPLVSFGGPAASWAGALAVGAGVALALWAISRFFLRKTPVEPRQTPTALVADGPYRINRNPMYTGLTLVLTGVALWLGSLSALIPAAALPVILTRRFVLAEEAGLVAAFGEDARAFLARTRRW